MNYLLLTLSGIALVVGWILVLIGLKKAPFFQENEELKYPVWDDGDGVDYSDDYDKYSMPGYQEGTFYDDEDRSSF